MIHQYATCFFVWPDCLNTSATCDYHGSAIASYYHHNIMDPSASARFNLIFNIFMVWFISFLLLTKGTLKIGRTLVLLGSLGILLFVSVGLRFIYQFGPPFISLFSISSSHFFYHYTVCILNPMMHCKCIYHHYESFDVHVHFFDAIISELDTRC